MIKKWPIAPGQTYVQHFDHEVIYVGVQHGRYCYWTQDLPHVVPGQRLSQTLTLVPTGAEPPEGFIHLGTIIDDPRGLVWHLYRSDYPPAKDDSRA